MRNSNKPAADDRLKKTFRFTVEQQRQLEAIAKRFICSTESQAIAFLLAHFLSTHDELGRMTARYNQAVREQESIRNAVVDYRRAFEMLKVVTA